MRVVRGEGGAEAAARGLPDAEVDAEGGAAGKRGPPDGSTPSSTPGAAVRGESEL